MPLVEPVAAELNGRRPSPEGALIAAPAVSADGAGSDLAELMMRFESLGSGCEFGVVQRHFGAEPISLLRWSGISVGHLVAGLKARFAGVGEPESVRVFKPDHADEYFFRDDRYGIYMHTFVPVPGTDLARLHAQQCRRVKYLAQKLIEALEMPPAEYGKIFVYKQHAGDLSESEIAWLHGAIRKYGEHRLLCVRPPDAAHPDGSVEMRGQGLMIGRIAGLSDTSNANEIKYETWLKVCRAADESWRDRERAAVPMDVSVMPGGDGRAAPDRPDMEGSGAAMAALPADAASQPDGAGVGGGSPRPVLRGFFGRLFGGKRAAPAAAGAPSGAPDGLAEPMAPDQNSMEDSPRGRLQEARRLQGEQRYADAELVVADALAVQPADPDMLRLHAELADLRHAPAEAAPRWEALADLDLAEVGFTQADCYRRAIAAYGQAGQHDRAEALAAVAQDRFGDNPYIALVCAYAAQNAGNWRLAQLRWARARAVAPDLPDGWVHGARSCSQLGLHDEAREILAAAEVKFPDHQLGVQKFIAYAAEARQDWNDAVRVWQRVASLAPGDGEAGEGLKRCQYLARFAIIDEWAAGL
jgi:tetratricopeptide (TPR) repeat protein